MHDGGVMHDPTALLDRIAVAASTPPKGLPNPIQPCEVTSVLANRVVCARPAGSVGGRASVRVRP